MSEIMKRKKGQILNNNERQLILNLMTYLKEKNSEKSISEVIREISKATGCSERTIYKIRKEASKGITVTTNRVRLRKKENKNSRNVKYDSYVKSSIRKKVYNYFLQNISPTLNTILCLINGDPDLPNFKRSTLHTLLKEIGFVYEQRGKKSVLTERNDLVECRREYLKAIQKFRNENRWIVYTGETLFSLIKKEVKQNQNEDDTNNKTLTIVDQSVENVIPCETIETVIMNTAELLPGAALIYTVDTDVLPSSKNLHLSEQKVTTVQNVSYYVENIPVHKPISPNDCVFIKESSHTEETSKKDEDYSLNNCSRKNVTERELRLTILHAGNGNGFIQGADFITLAKKKTEESDVYERWFMEKLLPKIPPNSIIVIDSNAPYHKLKEENIPDGSWKKQQIKNWLLSKNININNISQKKELLTVVNNVRPMYSTKYKLDSLAKEKGIIIVNLPPFHYELNPLNMVWAQVKYYVRSNLKSFKIKKIKELIRESFYSVSQGNWLDYIQQIREMEDLFWTVGETQKNSTNSDSEQVLEKKES